MKVGDKHYRTLWMEGSTLRMINQPLIPHRFEIIDLPRHQDTARAIKTMIVRGAGAIGASAGYGMAQVALEAPDGAAFMEYVLQGAATLRATRPTAQDLFYAIDRVLSHALADCAATMRSQARASSNAQVRHSEWAANTVGQGSESTR